MIRLTSRDFFTVNGVSSHTVGVYVDTIAATAMAERIYVDYNIEGREESRSSAQDKYNNIIFPIPCYTFDRAFDPAELYAFVSEAKEIVDALRPNKVLRVKKVYPISPDYVGNGKTQFMLTFECSPFRYNINNEPIQITNGDYIVISGTKYARPIFHMTVSGTASFVVNNIKMKLIDMPEDTRLTIDSERMIVYDQNGNVLNMQTEGDFPLLNLSKSDDDVNVIAWGGNIKDVTMVKNERWL